MFARTRTHIRALLQRPFSSKGGYVNFDPTAGQAMPDIPNVGLNNKLRAILFEYSVLSQVHDYDAEEEASARAALYRRSGVKAVKELRRPEALVAAGDASSLLRRELRAELRHRGLDATGKPWQLRQRLQVAFDAEREDGGMLGAVAELERIRRGGKDGGGSGGRGAGGADHREFPLDRRPSSLGGARGAKSSFGGGVFAAAQQTGDISVGGSAGGKHNDGGSGDGGAGDVRAKYMAAMRAKQDKVREREANSHALTAAAELGKAPNNKTSEEGSAWNLNHGAQPLLKYLTGRGMLLGIEMPSPTEATAEQVAQFEKQAGTNFAFRLAHDEAAQYKDRGGAVLSELCEREGLPPTALMLLTTQDRAIRAARDAGCFSCHFLSKNARRPNTRPNFSVGLLLEVQRVTEELNGISWRGSAVD